MTTANSIYTLLPKVMEEIGSIGKDRRNDHQRYNFRGIDDALNHVGPILTKHGVCVSVEFEDHRVERSVVKLSADKERIDSTATLALKLTFYAPDGSHITNRLVGEGQDFGGDKATNKAMSAAMKYGIFFGLVVPVDAESVDDSDTDPKQAERPAAKPAPQSKPPANGAAKPAAKPPQKPGPVKELKDLLHQKCGCKDAIEANAVIYYISEHAYQGLEQAIATPEDAQAVLDAIHKTNAAGDVRYDRMLDAAHRDLEAAATF